VGGRAVSRDCPLIAPPWEPRISAASPTPPGGSNPSATNTSRWPAAVAAFEVPAFRALWAGAFLSSLGTWIQDVGLAWVVYTRYQNPLYLGLRSLAAEAPLIAFMLVGGAAADRWDRRKILLVSQVLQMSFAAALGVLFVMGKLSFPLILLFAFLTGLAQSQSAPTYQATLTTLVPPKQIPNAVALNSVQFNLSRTIGPVVGGILLTIAGAGACFAANAISFAAIIAALARIDIPSPADARAGWRESVLAGFRHVYDSPLLFLLTSISCVGAFLSYPLITYLPVFAGDVLKAGPTGYSFLLSSFGVGAVGGALTTARRGHVPGRGRLLLKAWMVYATTTLGALLCGNLWIAMALLVVSGASLVTGSSTLISLVQENVPDSMRGRTMSIYSVAFRGGMPLGAMFAGVLVDAAGVVPALSGLTAVLLLLGITLYLRPGPLRAL
jgi:predicted MFS family arabinose efflux permease